jgi:hypothetical protein
MGREALALLALLKRNFTYPLRFAPQISVPFPDSVHFVTVRWLSSTYGYLKDRSGSVERTA